jgi:hypothetical protein
MIALTALRCLFKRSAAGIGMLTGLLAMCGSVSAADHDPLFASHESLQLVIEAPWSELIRRKLKDPEVAGIVRYREESGAEVELPIKIGTRGRSRLDYCSFPPLQLNFKRKQATDTLFAGQNRLKLVSHCKPGLKHAAWVRQEYLIYRIYNQLTDASFRARWLTVEYRDTKRDGKAQTQPAFLIEAEGRLADRLSMDRVRLARLDPSSLDGTQASLVALFHFMIGNTDWSALGATGNENCCHNGQLLAQPGAQIGYIVVPYDFDQAGLINTDYAAPSEQLRIRSVRTRLFRGLCRFNQQLGDSIELFNEQRSAIYALVEDAELSSKKHKTMRKYLDEYYEIINDPGKLNKQVTSRCRGPQA